MSAESIRLGEVFTELKVKSDDFHRGLYKASSDLKKFGAKVQESVEKANSAFAGVAQSVKPLAPAISLCGISLSGLSASIATLESIRASFTKWRTDMERLKKVADVSRIATELLTISKIKNASSLTILAMKTKILTLAEVQQNIASRVGMTLTRQATLGQYALSAATWVTAVAAKGASAAFLALTASMMTNPLMWIVGAVAALGALCYWFASGESAAERHAKAMEKVREQNDAVRKSGEAYADSLEKLAKKESLNNSEKEQAKKLIREVQEANKKLGKDNEDLGLTFDEVTGSIVGSDEALAKFRQTMRQSAMKDLENEFDALDARVNELKKSIRVDGQIGKARWLATYYTFGWVDNEEEIKAKIAEAEKKKSENMEKQSQARDYTDEYKEHEKALEEFEKKDVERSQNAYATKVNEIRKEFAERETILKQLIAEQELRKDLSETERKALENRKKALEGLNEEQEKRMKMLQEEERLSLRKIRDDFNQKRAEKENEKNWKTTLNSNPEVAVQQAFAESLLASEQFAKALLNREMAVGDENLTAAEIESLDKEVERGRVEAEKWKSRLDEADGKVAEQKELRDNSLAEIDREREKREKDRAKREEEENWKETSKADPAAASAKAQQEYTNSQKGLDEAYAKWKQLIREGATQETIDTQKTLVSDMEENIEKWRQRVGYSVAAELDEKKEATQRNAQMPATLMAGSVDAQRKFLENQMNLQNPVVSELSKTNGILGDISEKMDEMEAV